MVGQDSLAGRKRLGQVLEPFLEPGIEPGYVLVGEGLLCREPNAQCVEYNVEGGSGFEELAKLRWV